MRSVYIQYHCKILEKCFYLAVAAAASLWAISSSARRAATSGVSVTGSGPTSFTTLATGATGKLVAATRNPSPSET